MSGVTSQSEIYYASFIGDSNRFLEEHIHRLTRIIRPHQFYSWLRAQGVFNQDDQEEVENKFYTTTMKAGNLIDIVKTKGKKGFIAFMECVEFLCPELFKELTKKDAREPFHDFNPSVHYRLNDRFVSRRTRNQHTTSADILKQTSELTSSLMILLATKKEELERLNNIMTQMRNEQKEVEEDNALLYEQWKAAREQLEEQVTENLTLQDRVRQLKEELTHEQGQCTKIRSEKDVLASKCHELMVKLLTIQDKGREIEQTKKPALKPTASVLSLPKPHVPVKKGFGSCKSETPACDAETVMPDNWRKKIARLESEISFFKAKEQEWCNEKIVLQDKEVLLEQRCCRLQENNDTFLQDYIQMKTERDQFATTCIDLNRKYDDELNKSQQLTNECHKYQNQFRIMEEMICALKKEVDQRALVNVPVVCELNSLQKRPKQLPVSQSVVGDPKSPLNSPKSPQKGDTLKKGCMALVKSMAIMAVPDGNRHDVMISEQVDSSMSTKKEIGHADASANHKVPVKPTATASTALRIRPTVPDKREIELAKRQGSYLRSYPVILYAPNHLQKPLLNHLYPHFESCPYDVVEQVSDVIGRSIEHDVVIDTVSSPDGTSCKLLTVNKLKSYCVEVQKTVLLPIIAPTSIASLRSAGIEPVVVHVKLDNDHGFSELTAVEESLGKMHLSKYVIIRVEKNTSKDFSQLADYVLKSINEIVLKSNFESSA